MSALRPLVLALLFLVALATSSAAQQWDPSEGLVLKGKVVTQNANHTVIDRGYVCIQGNQIVAVVSQADGIPSEFADAYVVDTKGLILPGLIDTHNHVAFNFHHIWEPPKLYENRRRWPTGKGYMADAMYPKKVLVEPRFFDKRIEAVKYGEIRALVGGTTTIQGTPPQKTGFSEMLVRNIDYGLEIDDVFQRMANIDHARFIRQNKAGEHIKGNFDRGEVSAWFVHLAEGTDERSRHEFDILVELDLMRDETVVIHGTALGEPEFEIMAKVGADLTWSPLSNRLLYGKTTDVRTARRVGVNVCISPDWALSGSKNLLGELKVADMIDNEEWGNTLSYRDLVDMVTINPAKAIMADNRIGRLVPGYYADVLVIDDRGDPYGSLVYAVDRNVKLVIVDGDPLYGDDEHMVDLKGDDCEVIYDKGGRKKMIDVTKEGAPKGDQTLEDITESIDRALEFDLDDMRERFRDTKDLNEAEFRSFLETKLPGLGPSSRSPIFAEGDDLYFEAIKYSNNARLGDYDFEEFWKHPNADVAGDGSADEAEGIPGVVGGSLSGNRTAKIYARPRANWMRIRLEQGTPVTEIERKQVTARSEWVRVRFEDSSGEVVEGWMSARYFEPNDNGGIINRMGN